MKYVVGALVIGNVIAFALWIAGGMLRMAEERAMEGDDL